MGSCFARYIEIALRENKISVLSDKLSIDPSLYTGPRSASAALNKFNIPSMKNEFLKSLGHLEINGDPFIKVRDDQYFDTSTAGLILAPYEVLLSLQHQIAEFNKQILEADLFVCTLGLVEMFVDNETGCVLNTSPHPLCMKKYRGRFDHFRPDYGYLRTELADMLDLLAEVNPSLEVVVTVSPVPLQSTMTSDDVVVSNTLSKSLLRVVAQEASEERDNVSYFPSFEMVMNSPRGLTWEDDCIHVRSEVVKLVTSSFIENWFH
ncbi:GSCFA domain-containing protein [Luminiphilus sp.]|nr:GSCFA domain-containing protein [Luminiphilus sp.]